jgi:hypothetical protein
MTENLTTPELTPNAGEPTTPTIPKVSEPTEWDTPIVDDGLPFTPEVFGGNAS